MYSAPVDDIPQTEEKPVWQGTRLDLLRELWGEGNAAPTEKEFFTMMYGQLKLNSSMSVLDVGDGVGGASIHMAKEYGAYVDAYISNPDYEAAAERLVEQKGVQAHVRIFTYDIDNFRPEKHYDVASVRRSLWRVPDVKEFINILNDNLKPNGRIVIADYMDEQEGVRSELMSAWYAQERYRQSVSVGQLTKFLEAAGYTVRVAQDITAEHLGEIRRGLANLPRFLRRVEVPENVKGTILREADRWGTRAELLQGGLKFYRFFAQKNK